MTEIITGLDHAIMLVRDLDRAAANWRRLGFTLTERGHHTKLDTFNHCMMFGRDYLELLAIERPGPVNAQWQEILVDREGPVAIALATDGAEQAARVLRGRGLAIADSISFARPVRLPGGSEDARFTVTYLPDDATPCASMFFCQHHTRHLVWRPEFQEHANGAIGIASICAVSDDPLAAAQRYRTLVGDARVTADARYVRVAFGACALEIVPHADAAMAGLAPAPSRESQRLVGITLRVRDLNTTLAHLRSAGVAFRRDDDGDVVVAPADANGAIVKFV
jgi:catechol 2,3-dioxygenase-like lactoylglutathione lyase family enzyme